MTSKNFDMQITNDYTNDATFIDTVQTLLTAKYPNIEVIIDHKNYFWYSEFTDKVTQNITCYYKHQKYASRS